eukprot:scaffold22677_cov105-Isochrysis_galbana.AAC.8
MGRSRLASATSPPIAFGRDQAGPPRLQCPGKPWLRCLTLSCSRRCHSRARSSSRGPTSTKTPPRTSSGSKASAPRRAQQPVRRKEVGEGMKKGEIEVGASLAASLVIVVLGRLGIPLKCSCVSLLKGLSRPPHSGKNSLPSPSLLHPPAISR